MFVKYKINPFTLASGTTATTINIPVNLQYQIVDNAELVDRVFVDTETQKAVNPILDYDKVRFTPKRNGTINIENITYNLGFLGTNNNILTPTYYSNIGFDDADITYSKNAFTNSFLILSFYDSDNALTQNLLSEIVIYNNLPDDAYYPAGTPKPAIAGQPKPSNQIPIKFVLTNPLTNPDGFHQGYYIYNYKDEYLTTNSNYMYMRASYFNGKTGRQTNLMTEPVPYTINELVNKLYTRYKLYRDSTGFYYEVDNTYSKNVTYTNNPNNTSKFDISINLYQIQAL